MACGKASGGDTDLAGAVDERFHPEDHKPVTRQLRPALGTIVTLISLATALAAQAPATLAGTWKLATPAEGRGGRGEGGVPGFPLATTLSIKVSPTEVTVDSDTGSARSIQTSIYKLDGSSTNVPGPLGWETTAKAAIDAGRLVVTVRRSIVGPNGPIGVNVTDAYSVEGNVLTIERTQGRTSQKLVYNKSE